METIIAMYKKLIQIEKDGLNRLDIIKRLEEGLREAEDEVRVSV